MEIWDWWDIEANYMCINGHLARVKPSEVPSTCGQAVRIYSDGPRFSERDTVERCAMGLVCIGQSWNAWLTHWDS